MYLTPESIGDYWQQGYLALDGWLGASEIDLLRRELAAEAAANRPGVVTENDGRTIRALHGCHLWRDSLNKLTHLARLAGPAMQLLNSAVYVYQFKVNLKTAFRGDAWKWHQDYIYWRNEDGMRAPDAVNVLICVDEVTEFNGPLMMIPGSHRHGVMQSEAGSDSDGRPQWMQYVSADLKYTLDQATVARLVREGGLVAPKGKPGTVLLFHPNIAHASGPNLSPFDRTALIVTYNSVANAPMRLSESRPEFLVSRDTRPLVPIDGVLA